MDQVITMYEQYCQVTFKFEDLCEEPLPAFANCVENYWDQSVGTGNQSLKIFDASGTHSQLWCFIFALLAANNQTIYDR